MLKFKKRLPSGRIVLRTKRKKPGFVKCANCGKPLHGIPRLSLSESRKTARTGKKVNRIFGGYYCSACSRELLREKARKL